ncbi:MAG: hypothetical protein PHQ03_04925 [Methylococcales bacterium]|nr:hypothetical protein [Methylococcales bacterium]
MKTNIVPFKRRTTTPIQNNQIKFESFLFSVNAVVDVLSVILPAFMSLDLDDKDNSVIEFYQRHVAVIHDYQTQ